MDTGGVFRDITELFWKKIKVIENLNGGKLFDGDELFLIQQNALIIEFEYPAIIGKLLFWSWLQMGSWPRWLDPIHLQYAIYGKNSISCTDLLSLHVPYLYGLTVDIRNDQRETHKEDLDLWIFQYGLDVGLFFN